MENSKNNQIENLGVNKMGRNIKKTPLHHLNYGSSRFQKPESIVYTIDKEDFKSFVQRTTGSPNHPPNRPLNNTHITRLQKFRPPPLSLVQQAFPIPTPVAISFATPAPVSISTPPKAPLQPNTVELPWNMSSDNMVESPISAYMRQLLEDPNSNGDQNQLQPHPQPQVPSSVQPQRPQIHPQHYSINVSTPLVSENVTTINPIVSVNASNGPQFEPNGTIINSLIPMNVNAATNNSLMHVNVSNGSNQPEPNDIPIAPFSPTDFLNIPFPSPPSSNEPLFPNDIEFPSPESPCGPVFPTGIQLPTASSPPLFPHDLEFPSPQSPYRISPPFSPSAFFPMSPSGFSPMSPWMPGQI